MAQWLRALTVLPKNKNKNKNKQTTTIKTMQTMHADTQAFSAG